MDTPTAGHLLRAYYAALDARRLDDLDTLFMEETHWTFPGSTLRSAALVRRAMERSLATGLTMQHEIGHLLDHGDVAICELVATNILGAQTFQVSGAVVCEAVNGKISRLAAYPRADEMQPFIAALDAARAANRRA
jgi:ketosteroid isomerase-like protein